MVAVFMGQYCAAQTSTTMTKFYSTNVGDSFEIYISTPLKADRTKVYDVIYYCDANLKSGKKLREMINDPSYADKVGKTIFVGIGHIGNYHVLRRRDFILPEIKNGDTSGLSKNYGQAEHFYQFLKMELIPMINTKYRTNTSNNSILGHSLGGLFAFYCLFKNESLFKNFYALSPALWTDRYVIYDFNKLDRGIKQDVNLYFSTGSLELLNYIKAGADAMDKFLNEKKYERLHFKYEIHDGKSHNSQVEVSLDHILKN
ncbi:MAG TPA: alpha/beta hydrolase-fold protein [Ferruginibacter sp.]|nr:alpha/beta hydrolase-fold protein [Ferruginibacter sp.]